MMHSLMVTALGIRHPEAFGFTVDRPHGFGEYIFVRFYTPMDIQVGRNLVSAPPGTCAVYLPDGPHWYRGRGVGLINDWMHLKGTLPGKFIEQYGVPEGVPLSPRDSGFVPGMFEEILREKHSPGPFSDDVIRLKVEELFLKLARECRENEPELTTAETEYLPAFRHLRSEIHRRFAEPWRVEGMAAQVHLSPSRFAALYTRYFGVSPMEDLIRARLEHAKMLLTNRAATVREAAAQSGFANESYFSRLFHRRVGCAPRDYYRTRFRAEE